MTSFHFTIQEAITHDVNPAVAEVVHKKPGPPYLVKKTHNTIELEWSKLKEGEEKLQSYTILYSEVDGVSDNWNAVTTQGGMESKIVSGLAPQKVYTFKVRAEYLRW